MKTIPRIIAALGMALAPAPYATAQQFELLGGTVNGVKVNPFP